jgi:hypothetical protein
MYTEDLDTNIELLKYNLVEIISLTYKWGAIVLINEANIYLEKRSLKNI